MRRVAGIVSLAGALFACASPLPDLSTLDLEGWLELRSEQLVLVGNIPQPQLERFADDLALFIAVVERLTNAPPGADRVPTRIYLMQGRAAQLFGLDGILAGYMAPRLDGYYGVVEYTRDPTLVREVLLHEYSHYLVRKGRALAYPMWYDEGFAELMSTFRSRGDLVVVGAPLTRRFHWLSPEAEWDLGKVFATDRRHGLEDPNAFYALSWAVTHYLYTRAELRQPMVQFVERQAEGVEMGEAFASAFDVSLEDLTERVREHVDRLVRGALLHVAQLDARRFRVDREWTARPLSAARAAAGLGEIQLAVTAGTVDHPAARALLGRALELAPGDAGARAALALAEARRGSFGVAAAELERALAAAGDDPQVFRRAGQIERLRALDAGEEAPEAERLARLQARQWFLRAGELEPDDPVAWAGAGWSYVGEPDPGEGIAFLERALSRGAWEGQASLDLGRLYARAGRKEDARRLFRQVARIEDETLAEEASRLLDELAKSD